MATPIEHMGVDHGGSDIGVPEQLLNGTDVVARFEQMNGAVCVAMPVWSARPAEWPV